jgi:hypothetical protein
MADVFTCLIMGTSGRILNHSARKGNTDFTSRLLCFTFKLALTSNSSCVQADTVMGVIAKRFLKDHLVSRSLVLSRVSGSAR